MRLRAFLAALLLAGASVAAEKTVTLRIQGWHSKGDAFKTEEAVRAVKGVRSTSSDTAKLQIVVVFDDAVATQAQIEKAIVEIGYSVAR